VTTGDDEDEDEDEDEDDEDDDDGGSSGGAGNGAFLCAAHWATLGAAAKRKYSVDLRDDGLHISLCCMCCKAKHNVPTSELLDDGEDIDSIEWYCADCETDVFGPTSGDGDQLIESSATLIVCPSAICQQWVNEIAKHVTAGKFRVYVYNGLRSGEHTTAKRLAMQHIVITTYDVLRQDVYHSAAYQADGQGRTQRYRKKHRVVPTPLTALRWWRVCLDEAQMVETTTAKAAEMAAQIPTVNRWCVTGTPIAHGLDDLYGLLVFLRAEPLCHRGWWLNAIKKPCEALVPAAMDQYYEIFCRIMWRSARVDVVDQLRLPPQHEHTEVLEFSDIEAYYYERQHRECLAAAKDVLHKYRDLPSTEPILDKRWVQPFLRLRQACCHHQIGQASKTFLKGKSTTERPLTMAELTGRLLSKAKLEAEEAQRLMLMAINALAALMLLDDARSEAENHRKAVGLYRDVLQIAEEHIQRYQFKTDDLQRIHASINLGLLIQQEEPAEAAKLRESALELRKNYSKLERSDFEVAKLQLAATTQALTGAQPERHFEPTTEPWWTRAASAVEESGRSEEFVDRLRRDLAELAGGSGAGEDAGAMLQFRDMRGLVYVLRSNLAETWVSRGKMSKRICTLAEQMSDEDARLAGNCKLCRPWGKGATCAHCEMEKSVILGYELRLYSLDRDSRGIYSQTLLCPSHSSHLGLNLERIGVSHRAPFFGATGWCLTPCISFSLSTSD
jgi:E3 ubiquitin-protein ligase SHPRH